MDIRRVVVLGHSGFIGSRLLERLRRTRPELEVTGASLGSVDLTRPETAEGLLDLFDEHTSVVMAAAVKRQLGDNPQIYLQNTQIVTTFADLIGRRPPGRIVYLSSAAVYGEDVHNLAITEDTPLVPRSYYGLSKITAEWILQRVVESSPATQLGLLRPATIYGPGDLATAYGPSGFLDAVVNGRTVTLWGDGSELRELLFVDDVVRLIADYALTDHTGPLNVVAGRSYTFQDALRAVEAVTGRTAEVTSRPRSKPQVDNMFDASRLRGLFPDLQFTPLEEGVRRTHQERYAPSAAE